MINEFFGLEIEGKIEVSRFISIGNLYDAPRVPHRKAQLYDTIIIIDRPCVGSRRFVNNLKISFLFGGNIIECSYLTFYDTTTEKKNSDDSTHRNEIKEIPRRTSKSKKKYV